MKKISVPVLGFLAWLLSGCASVPANTSVPLNNTSHTIYVAYHGWHTSVVLDATQLAQRSLLLASYVRGEDFVRIGWGDGDYFTGQRKTWSAAGKALVASRYSALQLLTYKTQELQAIPTDTLVPVALTEQGLQALISTIENSAALDQQAQPIRLPGISADGQDIGIFFQATGHYSLLHNCNSWTAEVLQRAGLPLASRLTAQGVFQQASKISQIQAQAGLFMRLSQY